MGKAIVLAKKEVRTIDGHLVGHSVLAVDLDDLRVMFALAAKQQGVNVETAAADEKRKVLVSMGYEPYFDTLKQEVEYAWL